MVHYNSCPLCDSANIKAFFHCKDHTVSGESFELFRCSDCSFLFTQDIPEETAIGKYYESEDYISHSDTAKGLVNRIYHFARQWMLGRKRKMVGSLGSGKTLLDLGTGTAYFPDHMQQHGYQVTGVEVSAEAREYAREKFGLEVLPPETFLSATDQQTFDFITLWHVLEHLHDLGAYMTRMRAALKDDGHMLIAVPNHWGYDAVHYKEYWAGFDVPRHLWHFNPATMERLAAKNGLKITSMKRLPLDPFYNALLSEKYLGHSPGLLRGGLVGGWALLKSLGKVEQSSSITYILQKTGK